MKIYLTIYIILVVRECYTATWQPHRCLDVKTNMLEYIKNNNCNLFKTRNKTKTIFSCRTRKNCDSTLTEKIHQQNGSCSISFAFSKGVQCVPFPPGTTKVSCDDNADQSAGNYPKKLFDEFKQNNCTGTTKYVETTDIYKCRGRSREPIYKTKFEEDSKCFVFHSFSDGLICESIKAYNITCKNEAKKDNFDWNNRTIDESTGRLRNMLQRMNANDAEITNFVNNCATVLSRTETEGKDGSEVIKLLHTLGDVISAKLGKPTGEKTGFEVFVLNVGFSTWNYQPKEFNGYTFPAALNQANVLKDQRIILPRSIFEFTEDTNRNYTTVSSLSYRPVQKMVLDAIEKGSIIGSSKIISTSVQPNITSPLTYNDGVRVNFKIANNQSLQPECVFWNYTLDSWSNHGCHLVQSNLTHVECECNHLTDFSILMSVNKTPFSKEHRAALHYITLVGCIISIIFMAVMIFIIVLIKKLRKNHRYLIHLNLVVALMIGNIAMLAADSAMENEGSCLTVSILMFYFYLAAFCWMLCEGVFIWRAFVTVFTENERFWKYLLLGWGTPLPVVVITASVRHSSLSSNERCWLSTEDNTIYAFIAPALAIILVDSIILIVTLVITYKQSQKTNNNEIKTMARATLILLPLLGVTWLFGVFAVNEDTLAFKYVFTVLNSLQGFFLFVCYILISKEARKHIRSFFKAADFKSNYNISKTNSSYMESSMSVTFSS